MAIHGTNEDYLIGKAISHGCVRMHDKDVLEVSKLVPAGQPGRDHEVAARRAAAAAAAHQYSPWCSIMSCALHLGHVYEAAFSRKNSSLPQTTQLELVDVDVGAGHVDLDDGPALDAVGGHEALPRVVRR